MADQPKKRDGGYTLVVKVSLDGKQISRYSIQCRSEQQLDATVGVQWDYWRKRAGGDMQFSVDFNCYCNSVAEAEHG